MRHSTFAKFAFLLAGVATMVSCTKHLSDLYDPNYLQEQAKEAFPVKNIDPTHTWAMMSTRTVSVKVDGVAGAAYTVKIYSENPVLNASAPLMAKGNATGGQTASISFDAPTALERVFVSREGSDGRYVVVAELAGEQFVGSFESGAAARSLSRAAILDEVMMKTLTEKVKIPTTNELDKLFPSTHPTTAKVITQGVDSKNKEPQLLLKDGITYNFEYSSNDNILRELYVEAGATVTINGNLNTHVAIYVLPGAKLTLNSAPYSTPLTISVGENATWNFSNLTLSSSSRQIVYNKGTLQGGDLTTNQGAEIYNYGTINVKGFTAMGGGNAAVFYNDIEGTANIETFTFGGSGLYIYNLGSVEVAGTTSTTNNTGYWVNAGSYSTKSLKLSAHASGFHNYCKLMVKGDLDLRDGTINLRDDSYTEVNHLILHNTTVNLGSNSVLNVLNKTTVKYNNGSTHGLFGNGAETALIKLGGETIRTTDDRHQLYFSGKLIYAAEKMFEKGSWTDNVYADKGAQGVDYSEVKLPTPTEEQCAPDWKIGDEGGSTEDDPYLFTYAFEDMTREIGDYDFNDVVLQATAPENGVIKVTLLAAGATKELKVGLNNRATGKDVLLFDGRTVYEALDVPAGTITNTSTKNGTPITVEVAVGDDFRLRAHGDFYIVDRTNIKIHIPEFTDGFEAGNVPYAIRVPKDWAYPRERISIEMAYPDFKDWAQDAKTSTNWYDNPVEEYVFK
ncbi:MAG: LruC domain-containing protein [Phocaeicola sp.]